VYVQVGSTALIKASSSGHIAIVQLLLGAGAEKDARDRVGEKEGECESERITSTHLCGRHDCLEEAPCDLFASL